MGTKTTVLTTARAPGWVALLLALPLFGAGCQMPQAEMSERLTAHLALVDFSGLAPARPVDRIGVAASIPRSWELLPTQSKGLFTYAQWRSPSHATAVGVVHVRMPLPMSAKTLVWLAKSKYNTDDRPDDKVRKVPGGVARLLGQWSDPVGREWVDAENDKYRVRGYAVTCGFEAWIVYSGHKRQGLPNPVDIELANRSMDSVVPDALKPAR